MNRRIKKIAGFLFGLILLNLIILPAHSQTGKDILEKMIEALGGRKTLAEIKDTKIIGTMEIIQYGMTAPMTIYQKEPNKYRMEMEVMGYTMIQVYDGQKAMMTNPQTGEVVELTPDQTKGLMKQALGNDATLNPEKYGITYTYKGEETVDGKKYYVLEQKFQDGDITTMYLDAATYLPYKSKSKGLSPTGTEVETDVVFSDYRKVGNTQAAFSMTISQAGAEYIRMIISEIVYNSGLDDSLFVLK
ncbi:MAG: outer membrane lipoprotein-sorting protein [Candidatus Aminicenantes bacterium]|nr:outer membrane lipoprotein-sorting protein [Candidatus Aminicenantes bacterium]